VLAGSAAINVRAVYDYAIETETPPPPFTPSTTDNEWDSAIWDTALWDFALEGKSFPQGALGMGRTFAVGLTGNSNTRISVVGWDCLYNTGGFL